MKYKQSWLRDYFEEEGIKPHDFVRSVNFKKAQSQFVAEKIIQTFFTSREKYLKFYRNEKTN